MCGKIAPASIGAGGKNHGTPSPGEKFWKIGMADSLFGAWDKMFIFAHILSCQRHISNKTEACRCPHYDVYGCEYWVIQESDGNTVCVHHLNRMG